MHINQQQSFEYSIISWLQNLLPKSIQCHYNDWNIKYLLIYSCYEVVISLAGSRAMIRARASAKKHMHTHYLYLQYVLPASMSI